MSSAKRIYISTWKVGTKAFGTVVSLCPVCQRPALAPIGGARQWVHSLKGAYGRSADGLWKTLSSAQIERFCTARIEIPTVPILPPSAGLPGRR